MKLLTTTIMLLVLGVALNANAEESSCKAFQTHNVGNRRLNNADYTYFPLPADTTKVGSISFINVHLKSSGDSYINFMSEDASPGDHSPQIVLGGWSNTKSGAYCHSSQDWTRFDTPNVVSANEAREFYIMWHYLTPTMLNVFVHTNGELLFMHTFDCVSKFSGIGFASAWGHNADWEFCNEQCNSFNTQNIGNRRLNNADYTYFPLPADLTDLGSSQYIKVYVKSSGDSYINFMSHDSSPGDHSGQIVLGGWTNTQSGAYCHSSQDWTRFDTPNIMNANEEKELLVSWTYASPTEFKANVFDRNGLIFTHTFDCVPNFSGLGFASAWGHNAAWRMCYAGKE